jgi:hypothetical protein
MPAISPATDWFRRKRATLSIDPKAAHRRLIRMLTGDAQRPRPLVTLPGRHAGNGAPAPLPIQPLHPLHERGGDKRGIPRGHGSRSGMVDGVEPTAEDAEGPYRYEQLLDMDQRFVAAVERAFQNGGESRSTASQSVRWRWR